MNKKIFLGILALIILIGIGAFLSLSKDSSSQEGSTGLSSFFGFSGSDIPSGTSGENQNNNTTGEGSTDEIVGPRGIHKLHDGPIAGFSLFSQGSNTIARYQERARGYVYETTLFEGTPARLSSTTFPAVYESLFGKSGQATYVRMLDDQDTLKTTLFTVGRDLSFTLANNIESLVVSPDTQKAFYVVRTADGVVGYTTSFDSAAPKKIFSSTVSEWLASWTNQTNILLGTKPSATVSGSLSLLNVSTQGVSRIVSDVPGITGTLSPSGKTVLYTKSTDGGMETMYHTIASGVSQKAPFTTLPEKCVWSKKESGVIFCAIPRSIPRGEYPDQWYQGLVSFSDEIWKFDTVSASPFGQVVASDILPEAVDAISLALSPDETRLVFLNKKDGSLWGIDLLQEAPDIE